MTDTNQQPNRKQAVLYLRVSSAQQANKDFDAEGFSIPGQREACTREADKLGAEIVQEYIDRGESAKTAKRPALRAMLDRLTRGDIDYVIVHKVDRLARNRADDIEIVMAIRKAGAQLVSVTENIDETPSGLLLHGIMSSIAEFYSRNLAAEVMKGTTQKAKSGGTPFRAPIGYLNSRTMVDGREVRTITLDPERAPLIREAFVLYASGEYSLSELAAILEERGLRSRPTKKVPAQALGGNRLDAMLRNPYYLGIVSYAGKTYKGRHEPLVDEATFQEVQDLLTSKRISGERPWRHFHYLRGSLYCRECTRRLMFTRAKGKGGVYDYFVCAGRQHGSCSQGHHRVAAVEEAVERHYASRQLSATERERIRSAVKAHVKAIAKLAAEKVTEAERQLTRLDQEERKLLTAHYADQISESLFAEEHGRISRERVGAIKRIEQLSFKHEQVLNALDTALALTDDVQRAYCQAGPQERRLFNQTFFERLEIDEEEVAGQQLAEPFACLNNLALPAETPALAGWSRSDKKQHEGAATAPELALVAETSGPLPGTGGSNVSSLVPLRGFEPRFPD
ncbi:MAG: recombinase family protein [Solirubrobacterales bacterium]